MATTSEHKVLINATDNATSTLKRVEKSFVGLGSTMLKAAGIVGAFEAAVGVVKLGSQAEQAAISFQTLLKSGEKATAMLQDIESFAARTPFEKMGLTKGVQMLLGFGFAAESAIPTMQVLGDAIGAVGRGQEDLDGVILALGQIQAKGKLSTEEVLQMAERGLPIFDILRDKLGLTQEQIGNLGKEGIKSSVAIDAILTGLNERFAGAMAKQSKTLAGQWSTAMDNVKNAATSIIGPVNGALTEGLASVNQFFDENMQKIVFDAGLIIDTLSGILSAAGAAFGGVAESAGIAFDAITDKQAESGETWNLNFKTVLNVLSKALAGILIALNTGIQSVFGAASQGVNALRLVGQTVAAFVVGVVGEAVNKAISAFNSLAEGINWAADKMGFDFKVGVISKIDLAAKAAVGLKDAVVGGFSDMDATQRAFSENLGKSNAKIYDGLFKAVENYDAKMQGANKTAAKGPDVMQKNLDYIKKIQERLQAGKGDMFMDGGSKKSKGKSEAEKLADDMKKAKESASELYSQLEEDAKKHLDRADAIREKYRSMKTNLGELATKAREWAKGVKEEYADMGSKFAEQIDEMKAKIAELDKEAAKKSAQGTTDVAARAVQAEKELADAQTALEDLRVRFKEEQGTLQEREWMKRQKEISEKEAEIERLKSEISTGVNFAGSEAMKKAAEEAKKSETQKIIDRIALEKVEFEEKRKALEDEMAKKTADHELEMARFREKAEAKKKQFEEEYAQDRKLALAKRDEINLEYQAYAAVMAQKKALDDAYFANFQTQVQAQATALESVMAKMAAVTNKGVTVSVDGARADGGPVSSGKSYLVGERGPELFVPSQSGTIIPNGSSGSLSVSVNLGGVTVTNTADENRLVGKIKDALVREIKLARMGVA